MYFYLLLNNFFFSSFKIMIKNKKLIRYLIMEEGFKNKSEKTKYRSSARKKCSFRSHFFFLCSVEFTIQNRFGIYFLFLIVKINP